MSTRTGILSDASVKKLCQEHIPMNRIDVLLPMVPNVSGIYNRKTPSKPLPRPANLHAMTSSLKRSTGTDYTKLIKDKLATKFDTKPMTYFDRQSIGQQTYGSRRTQNTIITDSYIELFEGLQLQFESEPPSTVPSRADTVEPPTPTPTPSEEEREREMRFDLNRAFRAGLYELSGDPSDVAFAPFRRTPPPTAQRPRPTRQTRPITTLEDIAQMSLSELAELEEEPQPPPQIRPPTIETLGRGVILSEGAMSRGQPTRQTTRV